MKKLQAYINPSDFALIFNFESTQQFLQFVQEKQNCEISLQNKVMVFKWKIMARNYIKQTKFPIQLKEQLLSQREGLEYEIKILKLYLSQKRGKNQYMTKLFNQEIKQKQQVFSFNDHISQDDTRKKKTVYHNPNMILNSQSIQIIQKNHACKQATKTDTSIKKEEQRNIFQPIIKTRKQYYIQNTQEAKQQDEYDQQNNPMKYDHGPKNNQLQIKRKKNEKNIDHNQINKQKQNAFQSSQEQIQNWEKKQQHQDYQPLDYKMVIYDNNKALVNFSNGDYYYGQMRGTQYHGKGFYFSQLHGTYQGEFVNGREEGYGKAQDYDKNVYEGFFMDGKRHGSGKQYYINGDRYKGQFQFDKKTGYGTYYFHNGDRYVGQFYNDLFHGSGKQYMANMNIFEGIWQNDEKQGKGVLIRSNGNVKLQTWEKGRLINEEDLMEEDE